MSSFKVSLSILVYAVVKTKTVGSFSLFRQKKPQKTAMCSFKLTLMLKRVQCLAGLSFHYGALLFAGLSSLAPAQTREAKTENTLWQSCPPFYSGAFTIGTIVGQVNVSIQHVSRGILSTRCAHRCDGWNPTCLLGIFHWNKKKHRKRFSLYVFLSLSLFFFIILTL